MRLASSSFSIALLLVACDHPAPPAAPVVAAPEAAPPAPPAVASAVPAPEAPPAVEAPRGKRAPCTTDQSCNADPSVSALWGKCNVETGVCQCNPGFELHPSGHCQPAKK